MQKISFVSSEIALCCPDGGVKKRVSERKLRLQKASEARKLLFCAAVSLSAYGFVFSLFFNLFCILRDKRGAHSPEFTVFNRIKLKGVHPLMIIF